MAVAIAPLKKIGLVSRVQDATDVRRLNVHYRQRALVEREHNEGQTDLAGSSCRPA